MSTIADMLGVDWAAPQQPKFRVTRHAREQALAKGFSVEAVLEAANNPQHTYPSKRFPGQVRHVRGSVVAVIDPLKALVLTIYLDQAITPLRADQISA